MIDFFCFMIHFQRKKTMTEPPKLDDEAFCCFFGGYLTKKIYLRVQSVVLVVITNYTQLLL